MHSIQGGPAEGPPLVCLPGYGAGAAFYFRNLPSFCRYFKTFAVDPLGTGMSGEIFFSLMYHNKDAAFLYCNVAV